MLLTASAVLAYAAKMIPRTNEVGRETTQWRITLAAAYAAQ